MAQQGETGQLVFLDKPFTYEPLAWAVRKGDPDFLNWLNNFLAQVKNDGRYDHIYEKWIKITGLDQGRQAISAGSAGGGLHSATLEPPSQEPSSAMQGSRHRTVTTTPLPPEKRSRSYYVGAAAFHALVFGLTAALYIATVQVDYVWRWNRIPQYFFYKEKIEIRAEMEGEVERITAEGDTPARSS
ncbi:MAG: transporter substrate-binding domain-containing protein [Desulfobacterales bacterium]|nr:transporter substrate-binding domain-containing protein [Desulfobacterales bacterium]